jgi:DNA-directed RNA polymerase subunit RPC12/RpoP
MTKKTIELELNNLCFLNSFGYITTCPYCSSKIWINTKWDGLKKWKLPENAGEKDLFRCSRCDSIIRIERTKEDPERIQLFVQERSGYKKDLKDIKYPFLIDEMSLMKLIKCVLLTLADKNKKINIFYNDLNHFNNDMSVRIKKVILEDNNFPFPALEVA